MSELNKCVFCGPDVNDLMRMEATFNKAGIEYELFIGSEKKMYMHDLKGHNPDDENISFELVMRLCRGNGSYHYIFFYFDTDNNLISHGTNGVRQIY